MKPFKWVLALTTCMVACAAQVCLAEETLIETAVNANGVAIPYMLSYKNLSPRYVVILFPGGNGLMNLHKEDNRIVFGLKGNFLIRSRNLIVDDEFVTVATNSTKSAENFQTLLDDLKKRFPTAQIYLMGTSNGTFDTMALAEYLSDKIAGEIHTSSRQQVYYFDPTKYKNRHLIVHHKNDTCRVTPFNSALHSREAYGSELLVMEGGTSTGDACEAFAYHGYHGIERDTMEAIKQWIKQGG